MDGENSIDLTQEATSSTSVPFTKGRLELDVQLCTLQPAIDHINIYPNYTSPKGLAIIFNNRLFCGGPSGRLSERFGTDVDASNMEQLLDQIGYKVLPISRNSTAEEMMHTMKAFCAKPAHARLDSCVVVILSHGGDGVVYGSDGNPVSLREFLDLLDSNNCPGMHNKPKIVFVQACRGDKHDSEIKRESGSTQSQWMIKDPLTADTLVAYATTPGYVSWRNSEKGSWLIQAICEAFASHSHQKDMHGLLTKVNGTVSTVLSGSGFCQMPQFVSSLRKQLFLFPGLTHPGTALPSTPNGETQQGSQNRSPKPEVPEIRPRTASPESTTPSGGGYKDKTQISGNHRRYKTRKNYREKDIPSSDSESGEEQLGSDYEPSDDEVDSDYEPSDDEVDSDNEPESDQEKSTNNKTHLAQRQQQPHKLKNNKRKFQKLHKCSVSECGYETPWTTNLKLHHQHRHSNEKPFECSMCDYRCVNKYNLTKHEERYKGELLKCGQKSCQQRFCTTGSRTNHELLVHGSKSEYPFGCEDCNLSFKERGIYNRHMESAAHSEPLYPCAKCGQRFHQKGSRDKHQKQCKCANA